MDVTMFEIINLRHSWNERKGFRLLRKNGTEDYVFIHFITPVQIVLNNKAVYAPPHSCIIYPPHSYHEFWVEDEPLYHDWIHFLPCDDQILQKFSFPLNTLFNPRDAGFITSMVNTMELEFINRPPLWNMHVNGLMVCLFSLLGREIIPSDKSRVNFREDKMAFDHLRLEMYNNPSFQWNIHSMASQLGLSRSRFSVLYQQLYNTSPIEDLITARIHRAKYLLTTSGMTINRISDETGYSTVEHFVRQFKARTGYSPSEYRRSAK